MKKVRVLFLHSSLVCGGAEQALYDLISLIDRSRFDVDVMVLYEGGAWEQKFREIGVKVLSPWSCQVKKKNPFTKVINGIKRQKVRKALKQDGKGLLSAFDEKYDLVVSYHAYQREGICFQKNTKCIKYIHEDIETNPVGRKAVLEEEKYLKRFDRVICISHAVQKSFEYTTGIKNTAVHYNPLNSEKVKEKSLNEIPFDVRMPMICAVGRLEKEKGFARLIRIHKELLDEGIVHQLFIVGDGNEKENLRAEVGRLGVENSVVLTGYQENPYPYIRKSRFIVVPSFTEGLSVVTMEALALGIPIVTSIPTTEEIFGSDLCGIVTNTDDDSLKRGIRKMIVNEEYYKKAKEGAEHRSIFFDGKRMIKEVEEEFVQIVAGN